MAAAETVFRYAAGGGLHASLIFALPFEISSTAEMSDISLVLTALFLYVMSTTAAFGGIFYVTMGDARSAGLEVRLKANSLMAAVSGGHYALIPMSLVFTEGMTLGAALAGLVFFGIGFLFSFISICIAQCKFINAPFLWGFVLAPVVLIIWTSLANM